MKFSVSTLIVNRLKLLIFLTSAFGFPLSMNEPGKELKNGSFREGEKKEGGTTEERRQINTDRGSSATFQEAFTRM